jgi:SAM-dependent methyltransferase
MHLTAEQNANRFFENYVYTHSEPVTILEIGSTIGGFNIRSCKRVQDKYVGVDLAEGRGVDVVLKDPYILPFDDNSFDFAVSSSCFEHSEFFWLSYQETMRVLKPNGVFYLNAPSNGMFHRYPVDCWRFFPDSGHALINWGNRNGLNSVLLEQYTSDNETDIWSDFVGIFLKDATCLENHPNRIINTFKNFTNGSIFPHKEIYNIVKWG